MEFISINCKDYTVDLFTDRSREYLKKWKSPFNMNAGEAERLSGIPYYVRQEGRRAVILFADDKDQDVLRTHNPYFVVHTDKGWQIDIEAMARCMMITIGYQWYFTGYDHAYMFPFTDTYFIKWPKGFYRYDGQKAYLGLSYERWDARHNAFFVKPEFESPALVNGVPWKGAYLVSIDGVRITSKYQDWEMMKKYKPGATVKVVLEEDNHSRTYLVVLKPTELLRNKFPFNRGDGSPWLGLYYGLANKEEKDKWGAGWCVLEVIPGSPASKAGIRAGDLFFEEDPILKLDKYNPGFAFRLRILRDEKEMVLPVTIGAYQPGVDGL